jgi:hypothetical protein
MPDIKGNTMEREFFGLAMFLLSAVMGMARFRTHKTWDELSLWISVGANYVGTFILAASVFASRQAAPLVPLSLLILMHATAFFYKNHFTQIFGLPVVIGEVLLYLLFSDIRELFNSSHFLLFALIFHTSFIAGTFRLLLHLPRVSPHYGLSWSPYSLARKLGEHSSRYTRSEPST